MDTINILVRLSSPGGSHPSVEKLAYAMNIACRVVLRPRPSDFGSVKGFSHIWSCVPTSEPCDLIFECQTPFNSKVLVEGLEPMLTLLNGMLSAINGMLCHTMLHKVNWSSISEEEKSGPVVEKV